MIYYITNEIAIGIIHIGKPNFPLLKITAQDLVKELKKYEKDLLYYEEYLKPAEEQVKSEEKENLQADLDELEKVLSGKLEESIQKKEDIPKNTLKSTENVSQASGSQKNNIIENRPPSLEETLSMESNVEEEESVAPSINEILESNQSEEDLSNINIILNEIEKEFIKIIGPFGKYVFKKRKEEFFQKDNITKFSVLKFIHSLAEEIPKTFDSCPFCHAKNIGKIRRNFYKCYKCKKEWSVRKDSILEDLKLLSLNSYWLKTIHP